ncbi:IS240-type transposase (ISH102) [Natrinema altunense JCM 12890]|uniref:IS240-type transposase (ISH102) n=1 Tax=Natrinema altunense (strain JCM 12890 / CGMCC 1.3731 / AJ2) TaxID=1227494 RepID=M0A2E6_NATA2|nr:IS240-type transposase (ISH102) [Natrinema altunense JCM 12890]
MRTNAFARAFLPNCESREHDVDDVVFPVDGATPFQAACFRHDLDFRDERHRDRNSIGHVFREVNRRPVSFSNLLTTSKRKLSVSG